MIDLDFFSYGYSIPLIGFLAGSIVGVLVRALRGIDTKND